MSANLAVGIAVGNMLATSSAPSAPVTPIVVQIMGVCFLSMFAAAGIGAYVKRKEDKIEGAVLGVLVGFLVWLFIMAVGMVIVP